MKYYEFTEPYYALIKALNKKDAVDKYIENVAGDLDEYVELLSECKEVPEYYATAKFGRSKSEDGEEITFSEILEVLESENAEILLIDGSLL